MLIFLLLGDEYEASQWSNGVSPYFPHPADFWDTKRKWIQASTDPVMAPIVGEVIKMTAEIAVKSE